MSKVVVLSTVHYYKDARIFFKEIPSIKKKNIELTYIVPVNKKCEFEECGINIVPLKLPNNKFQRILLQLKVWKIIKTIEPDILHFHDPELIVLAFIIKKILHIKIIFDIHENVSKSFKDKLWLPEILKPQTKNFYNFLESKIISHFDSLIIAEKSYKEIYGDSAILIQNFPIINKIHSTNKKYDEINFVYSGSIRENRGAKLMLEVVSELSKKYKNLRFHLIGKIVPTELKESLNNFIIENNISQNVIIYDEIPLDEVYSVLGKCHFGFAIMDPIGNYIDSIATKIFDYMNFGVIPIVSDFEIYHDYVLIPETGILINKNDKFELIRKLEALMNNYYLQEKMRKNGSENLKKNWNWENEERILVNLYNNLLG